MKILETLLEVSLYSAVIFLFIAAVKTLFKKKLSPMLHYAVWAMLLLRLVLPFTMESPVHFIKLPADEAVVIEEQPVEQPVIPQESIQIQQIIPSEESVGEDAQDAAEEETVYAETQPAVQENIIPEAAPQQEVIRPERAPLQEKPVAHEARNEKPAVQLTTEQILIGIWMIGMGIGLTYIAAAYLTMRRVLKRGESAAPKRLVTLYETAKAEMGIERDIPLVCSCGLSSPGLMFPGDVVIPPEKLTGLSDESVSLIFKHELTHYKRGDQLVCMLLSILTAVYWFNPIVWIASAWIRKDMETACDSAVVTKMCAEEKRDYAALIIELLSRSKHSMAMLGMAEGGVKAAKKRIQGIFMKGRSNMSAKIIAGVMSVLLLICCFTTACTPVEEQNPKYTEEVAEPALTEEESAETDAPIVTEEKRNVKNILLLGLDSEAEETRGDFAIHCRIDLDDETANLTTIPWDLFIARGGERLCNICEESGAEGAVSALEKVFSNAAGYDIAFDGYMLTDFASLPKIAEAIGDVTATLNRDFPDIGKAGDVIAVNKDNIELYFRERKFTGGAEIREERQRNYIHSMLLKLAAESQSAETTEIQDVYEYFESDLSMDQLKELITAFGKSKVASGRLPATAGATADGWAALFADEAYLAEYVRGSFAGVPEAQRYTQKITAKDGKLTLNIDADVYRSARDEWPVYRTKLHSYSAGELRAYMTILTENAPLKNLEKAPDKQYYLNEIVNLEEQLEEVRAGSDAYEYDSSKYDSAEEMFEERIAEYTKLMNNAPAITHYAAWDAEDDEIMPRGQVSIFAECGDDESYPYFRIYNGLLESEYDYYNTAMDGFVSPGTCMSMFEIGEDEQYTPSLLTTEEAALVIAKQTLAMLCIEGMAFEGTVKPYGEYADETWETIEQRAYGFVFTRTMNGIPQAYLPEDGIVMNENGKYTAAAEKESLTVVVGDRGVMELHWQNREEIIETEDGWTAAEGIKQQNAEILEFSEITPALITAAAEAAAISTADLRDPINAGKTLTIDIAKIGLSYAKVRVGTALDDYRTVPAWTFYDKDGRAIFAINAVKGGVSQ